MIDHVIYATPDLDAAVAAFAREHGVSPEPGGRHLGFGTRNALVGLGAHTYLELVGIDLQQDVPPAGRLFGLDASFEPHFVAWCARANRSLDQTVAIARRAGYEPGDIIAMSRARPDGMTLSWTMTTPLGDREGGTLPFYIDWGTTPHPAAGLTAKLSLAALTIVHPEPSRICSILYALGEDTVGVEAGATPGLLIMLD